MFRRLLTAAGVAAAVAFVVGGGAFAVASGSGSDGPARTITVIEKTTSQHHVDVGRPGFSIGDEFTFNSVFWNVARTRRVGTNHGYCTELTTRLVHCVGTARLSGGTLEFAGNVSADQSDFRLAITGGTGALEGAEGQVTIHNLSADGSISRDVIELIG
jgi:allene oxide cyclase